MTAFAIVPSLEPRARRIARTAIRGWRNLVRQQGGGVADPLPPELAEAQEHFVLPAPEAPSAAPVSDATVRGPRTRGEQLVATVWRELLSIERIAVTDNFLDLGGRSLLIMQAIAKLEARTGKRISPRTFIFQTLEQIDQHHELLGTSQRPAAPTSGTSRRRR